MSGMTEKLHRKPLLKKYSCLKTVTPAIPPTALRVGEMHEKRCSAGKRLSSMTPELRAGLLLPFVVLMTSGSRPF
jgi:hypothetical protein